MCARLHVRSWAVGSQLYAGHGGASVEDLQWSPNEAGVFASCGVDGALRCAHMRDACVASAVR